MTNTFGKLVNKIAGQLIKGGVIDANDAADYKFGIEVTLLKTVHFFSYLVIALCMKKMPEFIIMFLVFSVFRKNTGGFHARTRTGCYFFSCGVIMLFLLLTGEAIRPYPMYGLILLEIVILLSAAPVKNRNRNLDHEEIRCFRRRLFRLSGVFLILCVITEAMGWHYIVWLYTVGLSMNTFLTVSGKIQYLLQSKETCSEDEKGARKS